MAEQDSPQFDPTLREAVWLACIESIEDPLSDNIVRVTGIARHERVQEASSHTAKGTEGRVGHILTRSEYAVKLSRGKYRITGDKYDSTPTDSSVDGDHT